MKRVVLSVLVAGALAAFPLSTGAGITIAQQALDFQANNNGHPDTAGSGSWKYMYSSTADATSGTGLLTWNAGASEYDMGGSDYYPDVSILNSKLTMAPEVDGSGTARYGVMRWTSGVSGTVNVAGMWTHYWSKGDGIDVAVYANGVQKFQTLLTSGSAGFNFDVAVGAGDVVDYVVGPGSALDGGWDRAYLDTTITMVPVPGAVLLCGMGAGLVGWLRRRTTL